MDLWLLFFILLISFISAAEIENISVRSSALLDIIASFILILILGKILEFPDPILTVIRHHFFNCRQIYLRKQNFK